MFHAPRWMCTIMLALLPAFALAQQYPTKPVRMILPFPPGGPTDILGRSLAQKLGEQMAKGAELDQLIRQKLGGLGYEF